MSGGIYMQLLDVRRNPANLCGSWFLQEEGEAREPDGNLCRFQGKRSHVLRHAASMLRNQRSGLNRHHPAGQPDSELRRCHRKSGRSPRGVQLERG